MPIYEFICPKCGQGFEEIVFASDEGKPFPCPSCGNKKTEKLMSGFSCGKRSASGRTGLEKVNACSPQGGFS